MNCCSHDCNEGRDCPVREACLLPERQYRPTYTVTGPYLPSTRAGWVRVALTAIGIAGCFFILGVLRAKGIL